MPDDQFILGFCIGAIAMGWVWFIAWLLKAPGPPPVDRR